MEARQGLNGAPGIGRWLLRAAVTCSRGVPGGRSPRGVTEHMSKHDFKVSVELENSIRSWRWWRLWGENNEVKCTDRIWASEACHELGSMKKRWSVLSVTRSEANRLRSLIKNQARSKLGDPKMWSTADRYAASSGQQVVPCATLYLITARSESCSNVYSQLPCPPSLVHLSKLLRCNHDTLQHKM